VYIGYSFTAAIFLGCCRFQWLFNWCTLRKKVRYYPRMIDQSQSIFYVSYALIAALVGVAYLKVSSTEGVTITTKEFKIFQQSFLTGYSIMILCELIAAASFFHTFVYLRLSLEQITKLYVVTIFSSTIFGILSEVRSV
jgi:K+-sensing histidine kinase KdpD